MERIPITHGRADLLDDLGVCVRAPAPRRMRNAVALAIWALGALDCGGSMEEPVDGSVDPADSGPSSMQDAGPAPTVLWTTPVDGASGVEPVVVIRATFSDDMDASTLNEWTFRVTLGGAPIAGNVHYAAATREVSFTPAAPLALLGSYTATITTAARSTAGTSLAADASWSLSVRDGAWATPQSLERVDDSAFTPAVAVDQSGSAVAVWVEQNTIKNIWANRFTYGIGWGTSKMIDTNDTDNTFDPRVVVDATTGTAIATWNTDALAGDYYDVWTSLFVPGLGWTVPELLENFDGGHATGVGLAIDDSGDAIAVWMQSEGSVTSSWSNRFVAGIGWGFAELIAPDWTTNLSVDAVAVGAAGHSFAVWEEYDGAHSDVWANAFVSSTRWGTPELLERDSATASSPAVAVDAAGNAIAIWEQSDGTDQSIWANRFTVESGGWGSPELVESTDGAANDAQIAFDGSGNAIAVWTQADAGGSHVWSNRFAAGAWGSAEQVSDGEATLDPELTVDAEGNALCVWLEAAPDGSELVANRFVAGSGWGSPQRLAAATALDPQIAANRSGTAMLVWGQWDGVRQSVWAVPFR